VAPIAFRTRLTRRATKAGAFLTAGVTDKLVAYYELLERWNRKINLTALDDPDAAIDRLLLEPVLAARHLPAGNRVQLMDIGSGGGSPAIPLTLASPSPTDLTMVEVKARKSAFLRESIRSLGLTSARVENSRFEELLAKPELHEQFDALSVRAVRLEPRMLMTLQAFLRPGGTMLLFRGPSGPEQSTSVMPPLEWVATVPLVPALGSRLSILRKLATVSAVPRLGV
jgi:16S rRNA (guanine527-N7)-methyltransferase